VTALEAEVQTLTASIRAAGQAEKELASRVEEERERLESSRRRRGQARAQHEQLATKHAGLIAQQQSLTSRYGGDLAAAIERARSAFVQAEARLADARRQLPPNAEKLPERSRRAAKAAEEVQLALEAKRQQMQRCEVLLEQHGAEGLYSRENAAEEALELARSEAERIRREGWALRLAAELIERREQSAIQTVLGPLEDRLSAVFAELTGRGDRRVFFDEHLAVRGIGRREDELIPFTDLSRGAREQLLLALRAAIALELAKKEPPCLILDDVLVHTDPMRQRNVLDYLQTLSGQVQIVILTCHAERYRGVGKMIATS
jgi:chromosome segregation ATPase